MAHHVTVQREDFHPPIYLYIPKPTPCCKLGGKSLTVDVKLFYTAIEKNSINIFPICLNIFHFASRIRNIRSLHFTEADKGGGGGGGGGGRGLQPPPPPPPPPFPACLKRTAYPPPPSEKRGGGGGGAVRFRQAGRGGGLLSRRGEGTLYEREGCNPHIHLCKKKISEHQYGGQ